MKNDLRLPEAEFQQPNTRQCLAIGRPTSFEAIRQQAACLGLPRLCLSPPIFMSEIVGIDLGTQIR